MKRVFSIFLVLISCFILVACGGKGNKEDINQINDQLLEKISNLEESIDHQNGLINNYITIVNQIKKTSEDNRLLLGVLNDTNDKLIEELNKQNELIMEELRKQNDLLIEESNKTNEINSNIENLSEKINALEQKIEDQKTILEQYSLMIVSIIRRLRI